MEVIRKEFDTFMTRSSHGFTKLLKILCLVFLPILTGAQTEFSYDAAFQLERVYFTSTTGAAGDPNWIKIRLDDNTEYYGYETNTVVWDNSSGTVISKPAAYVSGSTGRVGADIRLDCPGLSASSVYIRGIGSNGYNLRAKQAIDGVGGLIRYAGEPMSMSFPAGEVGYWDNFQITWYVSNTSDESSGEWIEIGTSENPLYVTFDAPELSLDLQFPGDPNKELLASGESFDASGDPLFTGVPPVKWGYKWFHTLFAASCNAASGQTSNEGIISKVWSLLSEMMVQGADSETTMFYYGNWDFCFSAEAPVNTALLLQNDDGQCGSWAKFFIDMLRIHGVDHSTVDDDYFYFYPSPTGHDAQGFFVKNWSFSTGAHSGLDPIYTHTFVPYQSPTTLEHLGDREYLWHYTDGVNEPGVNGQGFNEYPASIFNNHQITQIDGTLYDPSYGVTYIDLEDIELKAVDGYYIAGTLTLNEYEWLDGSGSPIDLNGNGYLESSGIVYVYLVSTDLEEFSLVRHPDYTNH
jgi:hypothetical protein